MRAGMEQSQELFSSLEARMRSVLLGRRVSLGKETEKLGKNTKRDCIFHPKGTLKCLPEAGNLPQTFEGTLSFLDPSKSFTS